MLEELRIIAVVLDRRFIESPGTAQTLQASYDGGVRSSGRNAQVVLQNIPDAVLSKDKVDPGNVGVHLLGRDDAFTGRQIAACRVDEIGRHDAVFDDLFLIVDILEEQVQRLHPLFEAALQVGEFFLPDDPGDRVIGEELLLELTVLIDTEFDAVAGQLTVDIPGACQQFVEIHHIGTFLLSYKTVDSHFDNTRKRRISSN